MRRYLTMIILAMATPAAGGETIDIEKYLSACETAIAERQTVPALYHRTDYSVSEKVLSREEFEQILKEVGVKPEFFGRQMKKFDSGDITPTDLDFVFEYEATNKDSEVVNKRSTCSLRVNRPDQPAAVDLVKVDGEMQAKWKLMNR